MGGYFGVVSQSVEISTNSEVGAFETAEGISTQPTSWKSKFLIHMFLYEFIYTFVSVNEYCLACSRLLAIVLSARRAVP
jgi:hypothetical protein